MHKFRRLFIVLLNLIILAAGAVVTVLPQTMSETVAPHKIELVNNQSFPVRMPITVKSGNLNGDTWKTSSGKAVQKDGESLVFVADLAASSAQSFKLQNGSNLKTANKLFILNPIENGIALKFAGAELGQISWQLLYRDSKPAELKGEPFSTKEDFAAAFQPISIKFEKLREGVVFDVWRGTAEAKGLQLSIELRAFHDGFLDINSELKNVSAGKTENVYAAVLTRWQQPNQTTRSVCYDNRISVLGENDWTNFRVGESRNWYVQHGVDWLKTNFAKSVSVAWFNDFSQSFTVHQDATAKRKARWVGANIPQIGFEAQTKNTDVFMLTEIARSNLKSYAERLEDNRLMNLSESISFTSRLAFNQNLQSDEQIDNAFVAYTSYAEQKNSADKIEYSIGVPYTRFGTNYFPYSTLGENFDIKKLPGMDRDGYWALAADTVNKWQLFADDIRRDLRIAKTLGFELIRLHHLELLYTNAITKEKRFEYLDFFFGELRKLKLKALIDAKISAEDTAELVRRYRNEIDGVEVDNEVLIFGINDDAPDYWKRVYAAVKAVAPEIPVHLTAHTNTGAFDRLEKLGVKSDLIGQHAYSDGLDSQPNMRGFSLAAASYGRRVGKPPIITEWNWRFLTRMTPEARARVYAPIFENVLKTRSMPTMYQFQFNESLAMNPRVLKGIRHYEQIWLSRRPKPEAFVLSGLIKKYAAPTHPNKLIEVEHAVTELDKNAKGTAEFNIKNTGNRDLNLKISVESPANLQANLQNDSLLRLKPNESKTVSVSLQVLSTNNSPAPLPGFYHVFLRMEDGELLRYGWAEARFASEPKFDKETKTNVIYGDDALNFNLNRPLTVVYGDKSPIQDVETASVLVNTLESATGRPVKIYELKDLPKDERAALILVGTAKTNQLINQVFGKIPANLSAAKQFIARVSDDSNNDWLIFSGADNLEAERAAMEWTIRFWKYAKDSAARRVGLVEKELPLGVDPRGLP
ncbi:MAG: hypothetical protein M3Q99_05795 [Acidobacteriota bacterium]|nr:hypothetical protein [Acidobacteriota bacterium]